MDHDAAPPTAAAADRDAPNHHAHFTGLSGWSGVFAALSMSFGRTADGELVADLTGVGPSDQVVDIGCGPGTAAREGARRGATVVGVDPARAMRLVARVRDPRRTVRYLAGGAEAMPLEAGWATVAWTLASVHHWPEVDAGIAEVRRVMAPGGRFVAVERQIEPGATGLGTHGWRREQAESFARRCRDAGFVDVQVDDQAVGARGPVFAVLAARPD